MLRLYENIKKEKLMGALPGHESPFHSSCHLTKVSATSHIKPPPTIQNPLQRINISPIIAFLHTYRIPNMLSPAHQCARTPKPITIFHSKHLFSSNAGAYEVGGGVGHERGTFRRKGEKWAGRGGGDSEKEERKNGVKGGQGEEEIFRGSEVIRDAEPAKTRKQEKING